MVKAVLGRGGAEWILVMAMLVVALPCCSLLAGAVTYTVGGSQGWTIGPNYTTWAAAQSYKVGDILFFPYAAGAHDVAEVDKTDYDSCVAGSSNVLISGNSDVTLATAGSHYFLCTLPTHCSLGMQFAITVLSGTSPAPAPAPKPRTPAPAPAPKLAPAPAPKLASAPSPTSPTPSASSPSSPGAPTSPSTPGSPLSSTPPGAPQSPPPPSPASSLRSFTPLAIAALVCVCASLLG